MAHLYQRGKKYWVAYYDGGRLVRKSVGGDKRLAEKIAKDIEGRLVREEHGLATRDLTASKALERFVEHRQSRINPVWHKLVTDRLTNFLQWAEVKWLRQVTTPLLEEYLLERQKRLGLSFAKKDLEVLSTFFNWAERMGHLQQSPHKRLTPLPRAPRKEIRFLSRNEAQRLLAACAADVPRRGPGKKGQAARPRETPLVEMATVAIYAGLRLSEIIHLGWEHVDFETHGGIIHVRIAEAFTPKDKEERRIPLHPRLAETLRAYQEKTHRTKGYVFQTSVATLYRRDNLLRELHGAARRAELSGVNWYTLRHTFASWLATEGVSLHKIARFLGYSTIRTTELHYAGLVPEDLHEDIGKL